MPEFERPEQFEYGFAEESFNYEQAADLAIQRLELEGAETPEAKQQRSQIKKKIKELYGSGERPERRIFDLELKKQKLVLESKRKVENRDTSLPEGAEIRVIRYDQDRKTFSIRHPEKNYEVKVSLGDLISDINWGIYYKLDEDVPLEVREQYASSVYQAQIGRLYDQQLIIQRTEIDKGEIDDFIADTYQKVKADAERGGGESAGLLFEKMIGNLLTKVSIDLKKWGIKIEKADVVDDVERKIDFIIELPKKTRGVGVEEVEDAGEKKVGIQFTLKSAQSEEYRKKTRQVAKAKKDLKEVDDLILISVPVSHDQIFSKHKKWQHQGKLPGGPENLFKPEEIVGFIKQTLQNAEFAENEEFEKDLLDYFRSKK